MHRCFDKRALAGLAVVAVAVFVLSPRLLGAFLPVLVMAACPLSMLLMMGRMTHGDRSGTPTADDQDRKLLELEGKVNRLKAEVVLRDQQQSA